ncbi:hypothetical protein C8J56DRAFT_997842 [Mycena floridula]|nr:hypothetical protein C8J56DRAFT_997842 [Mycena floridula]
MPPKAAPTVYQLCIKSHKLSVVLTVLPRTTIASVKDEVLEALTSDANQSELDVPKVESTDDFEISRSTKTEKYEVLDTDLHLKDCHFTGWETLYLQFRDSSGELLPVTFTEPALDDENDQDAVAELSSRKRKVVEDD